MATCLNDVQKHDDVLEFLLIFEFLGKKNLTKYIFFKIAKFCHKKMVQLTFVSTIMLRHLSDRVIWSIW